MAGCQDCTDELVALCVRAIFCARNPSR